MTIVDVQLDSGDGTIVRVIAQLRIIFLIIIDREIRPPCQAERPWSMFTSGLELSQINLYANGFVCECLVGSPGSSNKVTS